MWLPKGGRRQNGSSAEATGRTFLSWTLRWAYPAIQLVGPETTKEELLELYLEVYKLHRLPGSPPGELAILEEVLSSLPDHQRCEEEKAPAATAWPCPEGSHSSRSSAPHREKKDNSLERSLATVHKAHQKLLAAVATLEEEIKRLSWEEEVPPSLVWRSTCPQPLLWPQNRTWWAGVQWQRIWLGGATRTETNGSLLPERVAGDFWRWRWGDASRARGLGV